jgi:hypothetical protein
MQSSEKSDEEKMVDLVESFTLMPQIMEKYESRFLEVQQSELHKPAGMVIPKLPMYHPYHPFRKTTRDDILQVPLAMILPNTELVPRKLMDYVKQNNIKIPIVPYCLAQTLPYEDDTEVIPRYQYAFFPDAEGEMKGFEAIYAQSIIYEKDTVFARFMPTQIKIYESKKNELSPTILCGDSKMVLQSAEEANQNLCTVENLRGKCLWSLVLGSYTETLTDGILTEVSRAFLGCTYFIPDGKYMDFLEMIRDKPPCDVVTGIAQGQLP